MADTLASLAKEVADSLDWERAENKKLRARIAEMEAAIFRCANCGAAMRVADVHTLTISARGR